MNARWIRMDSWIRITKNQNKPKKKQNSFIYSIRDEKTSQSDEKNENKNTQFCWSFHYCCCCCCWRFFPFGFGFVLWELSQTFFNWFLILYFLFFWRLTDKGIKYELRESGILCGIVADRDQSKFQSSCWGAELDGTGRGGSILLSTLSLVAIVFV